MHGRALPLMWSLQCCSPCLSRYYPAFVQYVSNVWMLSTTWICCVLQSPTICWATKLCAPLIYGHWANVSICLRTLYNCTSLFEWAFHWCAPPSVYTVLLLPLSWVSIPLMCSTIWASQFLLLHCLVELCTVLISSSADWAHIAISHHTNGNHAGNLTALVGIVFLLCTL